CAAPALCVTSRERNHLAPSPDFSLHEAVPSEGLLDRQANGQIRRRDITVAQTALYASLLADDFLCECSTVDVQGRPRRPRLGCGTPAKAATSPQLVHHSHHTLDPRVQIGVTGEAVGVEPLAMLSILSLELPVEGRIVRRPVQSEDSVAVKDLGDSGGGMLTRPVEPQDQPRTVSCEVGP